MAGWGKIEMKDREWVENKSRARKCAHANTHTRRESEEEKECRE